MASPAIYRLVFSGGVADFLVTLPKSGQRKVLRLAGFPARGARVGSGQSEAVPYRERAGQAGGEMSAWLFYRIMKVYINGRFHEQAEAKVSVLDHGFLYGDGVFEGIRLYEGCVFRLEEHLERLEYSAKAILLTLPWTRAEIAEATCEACRVNGLKNGYIRLIVTRGVGSLGLSPKTCSDPQLVIIADKIQLYPPEFYEQGMKIITVPTRRINPAALPPTVKSLNYLNNILAKIEAQHLGYHEAIMLNDQGYVAECTGDNIFTVHKGVLRTPPFAAGALAGITRGAVLDIARTLGLTVEEKNLTRYDVWIADECFLTGTGAEVIAVVEVDGRTIGTGKPGPVTGKILEKFTKLVMVEGTRIDRPAKRARKR